MGSWMFEIEHGLPGFGDAKHALPRGVVTLFVRKSELGVSLSTRRACRCEPQSSRMSTIGCA